MDALHEAIRRLNANLASLDARWALIGGLAVSVRGEARTTRDVDAAILVSGDREAEAITRHFLHDFGYQVRPYGQLDRNDNDRLAAMRLVSPDSREEELIVDLMFAFSGIEPELVEAAEILEAMPGLFVPVAQTGHLLALKVLAARPVDVGDIEVLLHYASREDIYLAQQSIELISRRGYEPADRDLTQELEEVLQRRRA